MSAPEPILLGYFAMRPWNRTEDVRILPPQVTDMCNVGRMRMSANGPPDWTELWLHNDFWLYSTEARAWAAAVDNSNLHRLRAELSRCWDGTPGSVESGMDQYIACHVLLPGSSLQCVGRRFDWHLYAYRMFPVRFADGKEAPYTIQGEGIQPLPADYLRLGLDVLSQEIDLQFCYSPLDCNGWYQDVAVNGYCLLDQLETAFELACHWSDGKYDANGSYSGPAEPGPYSIVEVWRKRGGALCL